MVKLCSLLLVVTLVMVPAVSTLPGSQIETVEGTSPASFTWVSHGRVEGHLALNSSPDGAFSPDSATLAVAGESKLVLVGLRNAGARPLRPHIQGLTDLDIQSANYVSPTRILLLATGLIQSKGKEKVRATPLLAFQWNTEDDTLFGKVNTINAGEGAGRPVYFPQISQLGMYGNSSFEFWDPVNDQKSWLKLPSLTRVPNLYEVSPDGHWMLLAQVVGNSSADPVVVRLRDAQFVETLQGHQGTVLSMSFARDTAKVVTTCEDGKVRVYSVPDWKLGATLIGHQGPVHWAEFSPDGKWIASAGEDRTVRIWSAADGKLEETISESKAPVLTVAFSPNGEYLAATSEKTVFIWQRVSGN